MIESTTVVAESSPAPVETSFDIPKAGSPEYVKWRIDGSLPDKTEPKSADSLPADPSKEANSEGVAPEPESGKTAQEKRRPDVEARFKKLTDDLKAVRTELEEARRPKPTQAEPSPAPPAAPQNYPEWRKTFKPSDYIAEYGKKNPEATYEDAQAAMADYLSDAKDHFRSIAQREEQQRQAFDKNIGDVRRRYKDFDSVALPVADELAKSGMPPQMLDVIANSPVLPDLLYVIGGTPESKADFLEACRTNPSKALRMALIMEQEIVAELGKGSTARDASGKFTAPAPVTPAKRGPESVPDPPLEIGNRATGSMDAEERAFSAAQKGDPKAFRDWKKAQDAKELALRRGA